jgi:hypothetical protein
MHHKKIQRFKQLYENKEKKLQIGITASGANQSKIIETALK